MDGTCEVAEPAELVEHGQAVPGDVDEDARHRVGARARGPRHHLGGGFDLAVHPRHHLSTRPLRQVPSLWRCHYGVGSPAGRWSSGTPRPALGSDGVPPRSPRTAAKLSSDRPVT